MKPSQCSHAYGMIFDDDGLYCCCRKCEQQWEKDEPNKPWIPLVKGRRYTGEIDYTQYRKAKKKKSGKRF